MNTLATPFGESIRQIQRLYVRLLFCKQYRVRYASDPDRVLQKFGLTSAYRSFMPNVSTDSFLAEVNGRRIGVAREVFDQFRRTLPLLDPHITNVTSLAVSELFSDFLSSDYFFQAENSLPHPYGIGRGYENVSKFALWIKHSRHVSSSNGDPSLRRSLYTDFGSYLVLHSRHSSEVFFSRFSSGAYWNEIHDSPASLLILTPYFRLVRVSSESATEKVVAMGIVDLDTIDPLWSHLKQ